jgi:hypothetical protein
VSADCPDAEQLTGFVEKTLAADEAGQVRAHLQECDVCRETVGLLVRERRVSSALSPALAHTHPSAAGAPEATPTQIGRFTVVGLIARGGMGEVYRARDPHLGRDVAIKVLHTAARSDAEWSARFEREARTISQLNHPNILALYDLGVHEGAPYVVTEFLDGMTLRAHLVGPLPVARAVEIGAEVAAGLAAAHDKGVVHRDIKPENILLTRDGRVKILDFGLAKYQPSAGADSLDEPRPTEPGMILGTIGYMAPEQVRGRAVDARSDIFSLGVVLYEMLVGEAPFRAATDAEVMSAVLRDAPPALPESLPWVVTRLVARCLAKDPLDRVQSARDLAADLRASLPSREHVLMSQPPPAPSRRRRVAAAGGLALAGLVAGAGLATTLSGRGLPVAPARSEASATTAEAHVDYTRLTFRRGPVENARFGPDGRTVIYSAIFDADGARVYATAPGGRESRPLTDAGYSLAAVGPHGELAVLRGRTLARTSLSGGTPRDVAEGVIEADFTPAGDLVTLRADYTIEFPLGNPVYHSSGTLRSLRVAPDGSRVAFVERPIPGDDAGRVCTVARAGAYECRTDAHWYIMNRVVWAPASDELWFSALDEGSHGGVYAVGPSRRMRPLLALPQSSSIFDVGPAGAVVRIDNLGMAARYRDADGGERDLSWLDVSMITGLARDGSAILFAEGGMGGSSDYEAYLRPTAGGPALDIGSGFPAALSDDQKWVVLFQRREERHQLVIVPTGAGAARTLPSGAITRYVQGSAGFLPGATGIVFTARAQGDFQVFSQDVASGDPVPLTGEGWRLASSPVSPDGRTLLCVDAEQRYVLRPIAGGSRSLPQLRAGMRPLGWSGDGRALFVLVEDGRRRRELRLDVETGAFTPVADVPGDRRLIAIGPFATADGHGLAWSELREAQDLFVIGGLGP